MLSLLVESVVTNFHLLGRCPDKIYQNGAVIHLKKNFNVHLNKTLSKKGKFFSLYNNHSKKGMKLSRNLFSLQIKMQFV